MNQHTQPMVGRLAKVWVIWFCIYMLSGAFAMMQNRTSLFTETVDDVDSLWLKLIFLNLPLQIVLAIVAMQLDRSLRPGARRVGIFVAVITTVLIGLHVVISIATHFAQ
jgi:hypothetical protein